MPAAARCEVKDASESTLPASSEGDQGCHNLESFHQTIIFEREVCWLFCLGQKLQAVRIQLTSKAITAQQELRSYAHVSTCVFLARDGLPLSGGQLLALSSIGDGACRGGHTATDLRRHLADPRHPPLHRFCRCHAFNLRGKDRPSHRLLPVASAVNVALETLRCHKFVGDVPHTAASVCTSL